MTEQKEYKPEFVYPYGFRELESDVVMEYYDEPKDFNWEQFKKDLEKAKEEVDQLTK